MESEVPAQLWMLAEIAAAKQRRGLGRAGSHEHHRRAQLDRGAVGSLGDDALEPSL